MDANSSLPPSGNLFLAIAGRIFSKIRQRRQWTFRRRIGQVTSNTSAGEVSGIWRGRRERINRVSGGLAPEFQTFPVSRWRRQRGNSAGRGVRVAGARDGTKVSVCIKPREPGGYRLSVRRLPPRRLLCGLRTARGYVPCLTSSATQIQLKLRLSASASPAFPRLTLSLSLCLSSLSAPANSSISPATHCHGSTVFNFRPVRSYREIIVVFTFARPRVPNLD